MISNSSKIALTKKIFVSVVRKFFCTSRIKNIEKYFFNIQKHGFHVKNYIKKLKKIGVHQQEYSSPLKFNFPQISVISSFFFPFSISTKNLISLDGINDWLKNMFQLKKKLLPLAAVDCCLRKWKKMVSTSQEISCPLAEIIFSQQEFFKKLDSI